MLKQLNYELCVMSVISLMTQVGAKLPYKKEWFADKFARSVGIRQEIVSVATIPEETRICPVCLRELDHSLSLEQRDITMHSVETGRSTVYTVLVRSDKEQVGRELLLTEEAVTVLEEHSRRTSLATQLWGTEDITNDPILQEELLSKGQEFHLLEIRPMEP